MTTMTFKVTGEAVTEIARNLFLERNWRKALNLLVDGLHGITHQQAIEVLMCEAKLVGENDNIDLVDDEPDNEYLPQLHYIYPASLEYKDRYYSPSSYVSGYCVDDMMGPGKFGNINHATKCSMTSYGIVSDDKIWRSLYYAKESRTALAVDLRLPDGYHDEAPTRDRVILFEEIPMPPFWLPMCYSTQEALENFLLNGGVLERVGGDTHLELKRNLELVERGMGSNIVEDNILDIANASGLDPEDVGSILSTEDDSNVPPEIDKNLDGPCAYILTNGSIYNCTYMKHRQLASRILKFIFNRDDIEDPEKELEANSAVQISRSALDHRYKMMIVGRITPSQRSVLRKWMNKYPDTDIEDFGKFYNGEI